jgi:hypothetical protein
MSIAPKPDGAKTVDDTHRAGLRDGSLDCV